MLLVCDFARQVGVLTNGEKKESRLGRVTDVEYALSLTVAAAATLR